MIDMILFGLIVGAFYGGFKAGNRWKTLKDMVIELVN